MSTNKTDLQNAVHYNNSGTLTIFFFQYLQNTEGGVIVSQELHYLISLKTNIVRCFFFFFSFILQKKFCSKGYLTLGVKWEFIMKVIFTNLKYSAVNAAGGCVTSRFVRLD